MVVSKSFKHRTGNSSKSKYVIYTKILVILVLALVLVSLVYVLFIGKGKVAGKAVTSGTQCYSDNSGFKVKMVNNNQKSDVITLCDGTTTYTCGDQFNSFTTVRNVENLFDAVCLKNGDYSSWFECDADGRQEIVNSDNVVYGYVNKPSGVLDNDKRFLCYKKVVSNGFQQVGYKGFETWAACNVQKTVSSDGGNFYETGHKVSYNVGSGVKNFLCEDSGWKKISTKESNCFDNNDDDADGKIDCADEDCVGANNEKNICAQSLKKTCYPYNNHLIANVDNHFEALCINDMWLGCDADDSGDEFFESGYTYTTEKLIDKNYLCAKNVDANGVQQQGYKGYESWFICGKEKLPNSGGIKKNTGDVVEGYKCKADGWYKLADCSDGNSCVKEECQKYIVSDSTSKVDTLCANTKANKCGDNSNPFGTVLNVGGLDALCAQNGGVWSWIECDANGIPEKLGQGDKRGKGAVVSVGSTDYLCTLKDGYEGWRTCKNEPYGKKGFSEAVNTKLEGKVCVDSGKWVSDTCTKQGEMKKEGSTYYVCDGTWKACDDKGDLAVGGKFLCGVITKDGWEECKSKNTYTPDGLYFCDGNAWSAVASLAVVSAPEGFYWEQAPVQSADVEMEACVPVKSAIEPKSFDFKIPPVCCSSSNYCGGLGYTLESLSTGFGYCYAKNTVYNLPSTPLSFFCNVKDGVSTWTYCDKNTIEKIKNEGKFACAQNEKKDYAWLPCVKAALAAVDTLYCDGVKWSECNSAMLGIVSSDSQYVCLSNKWSTTFNIGSNGMFEVKLMKGAQKKNINQYKDINLCDLDSNFLISKATVCYVDSMNKNQKILVNSDAYLYSGAKTPYFENNLLFLYQQEAEPKEVDVLLLEDVNKGVNLSLNAFTTNLINGRRLGILVNNQYYVLSHPKAMSFDFSQMILTHLPDHKVYNPIKSPSNVYQFKLSDAKVISVNIPSTTPNMVVLRSDLVYEAPTVSAESQSLLTSYELSFSLDKPITLSDVSGTVLTVCSKDIAVDPFNLLVCENGQYKETLQKDVLKSTTIGNQKVAFLYEYVDKKKVGRIFLRQDVKSSDSVFDYNIFAESLAAGRRAAISFEGKDYLIEHPVDSFSMLSISLASYSETGKVSYPSSGSEKQVEFLPLGKIILTRDQYNLPPPPFKIKGITSEELKKIPINLSEQFLTTMSNHVPALVTTPNFGMIESDDKLGLDAMSFRIKFGGKPYDLLLKQPLAIGTLSDKAVFYYDTVLFDENNKPLKMAKMYYLYDLDGIVQSHIYNDTFIETFTSGKEFGLFFEKSYYLLGYEGATSGQKSFFDLNKVKLHFLNGTTAFPREVDAALKQASFTVPGGKIYVKLDSLAAKPAIVFSAKTEKELATIQKESLPITSFNEWKYVQQLTVLNKVEIKKDGTGVRYTICDTPGTATNEQLVVLCEDGKLKDKINLNKYLLIGNYLFWYKGMVDGQKEIQVSMVQNLANVNPISMDWALIRDSVKANQMGTLFWNNNYFQLQGDDLLSDWTLNKVPTGEVYNLDVLTSTPEGLQGGVFAYEKNLLLANQTWDSDFNVDFTLKPLNYYLLTENGFNVSIGSKQEFVPALSSSLQEMSVYTLNVESLDLMKNLVGVVIFDQSKNIVFLSWMPDKTVKHVLLPSGDVITLETMKVKMGQQDKMMVHVSQ